MKLSRSALSSAEVGSSAITSSGWPISARAAATRCCWPTDSCDAGRAHSAWLRPTRCSSAAGRGLRRPGGRRRALPAQAREAAGQQHVVQHAQVGQQVELLEDVAHVVGAEGIAPRAGQRGPGRAEQADRAGARQQHAGQQPEQRALAAAAGAVQEQRAPGGHLQRVDGQAVLRRPRPAVAQRAQLDHGPSTMRVLGRFNSRLNCAFGKRQLHLHALELVEGEQADVDMTRRGVASAQSNSQSPSSSAWPSLGAASAWPSLSTAERELDAGHLAARGGVELEHLIAGAQPGDGLVDALAFAVGARRALEAHQVVQRGLEAHRDLLRFDGDVHLGDAVHMGMALRQRGQRRGQQQAQGEAIERLHDRAFGSEAVARRLVACRGTTHQLRSVELQSTPIRTRLKAAASSRSARPPGRRSGSRWHPWRYRRAPPSACR